MINSDDLAFFTSLAGSTTLSDCARKLNVTPPAITQRLRALEERIGVRLIDRSGRRLSLTEEGSLLASQGQAVIDTIEDLEEALADRRGVVRGHLKVAAPHGFGRRYVAPVAGAFAEQYPNATVVLELSDNPAALLMESYDLIVHIGAPGRMDAIVTTLAPNRRILCASPLYLKNAREISTPGDLAHHRCLSIRENNEDVTLWRFRGRRREIATVRVKPVMSSNDGEMIREWALAGLGIAIRSEWDVAKDLSSGRLHELLPRWEVPAADVVAMLGSRHGRSARANVFLSTLKQALAEPPWRRSRQQTDR